MGVNLPPCRKVKRSSSFVYSREAYLDSTSLFLACGELSISTGFFWKYLLLPLTGLDCVGKE